MSYRPRASNGQLAPLLIGGSFLGVCVLVGGGTRQGLPVEAMLQLLSLPLIVYAGMRLAGRPLAAVTSIALVLSLIHISEPTRPY